MPPLAQGVRLKPHPQQYEPPPQSLMCGATTCPLPPKLPRSRRVFQNFDVKQNMCGSTSIILCSDLLSNVRSVLNSRQMSAAISMHEGTDFHRMCRDILQPSSQSSASISRAGAADHSAEIAAIVASRALLIHKTHESNARSLPAATMDPHPPDKEKVLSHIVWVVEGVDT